MNTESTVPPAGRPVVIRVGGRVDHLAELFGQRAYQLLEVGNRADEIAIALLTVALQWRMRTVGGPATAGHLGELADAIMRGAGPSGDR